MNRILVALISYDNPLFLEVWMYLFQAKRQGLKNLFPEKAQIHCTEDPDR